MGKIPKPVKFAMIMWLMLTGGATLIIFAIPLPSGNHVSFLTTLTNFGMFWAGVLLLIGAVHYAVSE